jgi:hypothetical protein
VGLIMIPHIPATLGGVRIGMVSVLLLVVLDR